ncbi:MAG: tetratricopeptide repeat protein, partial [FCB group bacterium]|nr:tetratricopeptide repeat protein [FCB group bacterium]
MQKNAEPAKVPQSVAPDVIAEITGPFNKGVSLMDQYKASDAATAFRQVTAKAPGLIAGHLNLGIALLNTQNEMDLQNAEKELKWVIERDPGNPHAHYSLGMLYKHLNRYSEAQTEFENVLESDPDDGDAHYQLAILIIEQNPEAARTHLEKTLEKIPHHEAALYRLNKLLQTTGESSAANTILKRYHELKSAGAGVVYGMKYGEMGRYAEVVRTLGVAAPEQSAGQLPAYRDVAGTAGLTFTSRGKPGLPGEASRFDAGAFGPGLTLAFKKDLSATLLYITGSGPSGNGILLAFSEGRFTEVKNSGINGRGAVGAFFGDYDQDGDADLYLTCAGPNRLYRNDSDTVFTDITPQTKTGGGNVLSVGAAWADADHDGDLDLYVANYSAIDDSRKESKGVPNNLWRNNGDGTFTDIAKTAGVDGGSASTMSVLFYDLDNDRDQDLYLINNSAPNRIFYNDRVGQFTEMTDKLPLLADGEPGLAALPGDVDHNGLADILLLRGAAPPELLLHTSRDYFAADTAFSTSVKSITSTAGGLLGDLDLDGDLDLILLSSTRLGKTQNEILLNDGTGHFAEPLPLGTSWDSPDARGALAFDFDGNGSLEILITKASGSPSLWQTQLPPDRHWLEVLPVVKSDVGEVWPDAAANGCAIECKADRLLQIANLQGGAGYLGSQTVLLHFGLGSQSRADYVRLTWPDALFQTESEVAADQRWQVTKIEKKPSSCPMLFSWDGNRFSFVTDFLGVGGVGFFIEPGFYGPPDPTEDILIPKDQISPRGGRYLLSVAEPLEEVSYIDQLYLIAYDHPGTYEIYPDERFTGSPPFPT